MAKTVALLATLDTKGVEIAYMRDCVIARGHRALVIDSGLMGEAVTTADIPNTRVAQAGGSSLQIATTANSDLKITGTATTNALTINNANQTL